MREITIGERTIRVRATPLALLFYRQAFNSDLVGDLAKMQGIEKDPSQFDSISVLQMTWAMARAEVGPGESFPDFPSWLNSLESLDFSEPAWIVAAMEEAADGFFRKKNTPKKPKRAASKKVRSGIDSNR